MRLVHLRFLLAVVVVGTVVFLPPAYGKDGYEEVTEGNPPVPAPYDTCDPDEGRQIRRDIGVACFYPYNDVFWLGDQEGDGRSVAIQWKIVRGARHGIIRNKLGVSRGGYLDKDLPEGKTLKWRIGSCSVSSTRNCHEGNDYPDWGIIDGNGDDAFCISINLDAESRRCLW